MRAGAFLTSALISLLALRVSGDEIVDGGWTDFSFVSSPCSVSCGGGLKTEYRSCDAPPPSNGGRDCEGPVTRRVPCNEDACPTSGGGQWTDWGECSENCTWGVSERSLLCGEGANKTVCTGEQETKEYKKCIMWNITRSTCPDPCTFLPTKDHPLRGNCPLYSSCKDRSTDQEPIVECECILGYELNKNQDACIRPAPPTPQPRPIPTLAPEIKQVVAIITTSASSIILAFLGLTLCLFLLLRIFTRDRIIQMNMEIALAGAHICLIFPLDMVDEETPCRILSIFIHFFFTACFMFIFLEAVHMYSLVAFVVRRDGLFNNIQNVIIGWGLSAAIVVITMCFAYEDYAPVKRSWCWIQMDVVGVTLGSYVPICTLTILTLIIIEAAGNAEYKKLTAIDGRQLFSAKVSQRVNLLILFMVLATFCLGTFSYYEMNPYLYGVYSTLNSVLGAVIFLGHTMGNQVVREHMISSYRRCCGHDKRQNHKKRNKK